MPPVKKNEKNAFSFYMDEFIPRLREEGKQMIVQTFCWSFIIFNCSTYYNLEYLGININHKQEAVPHLLAEWKALPKEEKFPYE